MFYFRYLLTTYILVLAPITVNANESLAIQLLTQQLQAMSSLQGIFNQQIKDNKGQILQQASGSIRVKRPRRLLWRTTEPYEHLVVTDGKILWLYDIDLQQVSKQVFTADLDHAPALLLSGEIKQIASQYEVSIIKQADTDVTSALKPTVDKSTTFELLPLKDRGLFSRLTITFRSGKPISMSLQDSFDQHTVIDFSEVQINPVLEDKLFQFSAPKGVDVISND